MSKQIDRQKLAKLLGMMGSAHDGEILAAAKAAQRLLTDAKATWFDVVAPEPMVRIIEVPTRAPDRTARELALEVLHSRYLPDEKEGQFLRDLLARNRPATAGQTRWAKMIAVKAGVL